MKSLSNACLAPHVSLLIMPIALKSFCCQPFEQAHHAKHRGVDERHLAGLHDATRDVESFRDVTLLQKLLFDLEQDVDLNVLNC